jgi:glycosyltransferase involved in cell wall biosynthesis
VSEPFAVLLPVYAGDRPDFLRRAFRSAVDDQRRRPDQVVLVRDGPVPEPLERCLDDLERHSPVPVTLVRLGRRGGLGPALDAGLAASHYDIVARMDADDVSMPHRFAVQLPLIESGADIVGSGLLEFRADLGDVVGRRTPPCEPDQIVRSARFHDPFNHPTVVYRRSAVLAAGGYRDLPLMEDYWLFARMLAGGARPANVAEPLVYYRVSAGAYARRGGLGLLRSELRLHRHLHDEGFTTTAQSLRNIAVRGGYRLLPEWFRRPAYRAMIAPRGRRGVAALRRRPPRSASTRPARRDPSRRS